MKVKIGEYLRDLRLANSQTLKQMAEELGVSSAFLSAVENGKKNMPEKWYDSLSEKYNLSKAQIAELQEAVEESSTTVKLNLTNVNGINRELAISFARSFENLNESDSAEIMKILER